MKYKYNCLNPIADCGLKNLGEDYARTEKFEEADAVFVRSAKMDELVPGPNLLAVARAGAGVNNIPHAEYAKKGIVVFNTPGANANGVKELVIAAMLLASRDIVGGIEWVKENASDPAIGKAAEKAKKAFAGTEIQGKKLGVIGLGAIGQKVATTPTFQSTPRGSSTTPSSTARTSRRSTAPATSSPSTSPRLIPPRA